MYIRKDLIEKKQTLLPQKLNFYLLLITHLSIATVLNNFSILIFVLNVIYLKKKGNMDISVYLFYTEIHLLAGSTVRRIEALKSLSL